MAEKVIGHLTIETSNEPISLDVFSSIFEQNTIFEFDSEEKNIKEYFVSVDVENLSKESFRELEEIKNNIDNTYNIKLNYNGTEEIGKATISELMDISGVTLDLKITE